MLLQVVYTVNKYNTHTYGAKRAKKTIINLCMLFFLALWLYSHTSNAVTIATTLNDMWVFASAKRNSKIILQLYCIFAKNLTLTLVCVFSSVQCSLDLRKQTTEKRKCAENNTLFFWILLFFHCECCCCCSPDIVLKSSFLLNHFTSSREDRFYVRIRMRCHSYWFVHVKCRNKGKIKNDETMPPASFFFFFCRLWFLPFPHGNDDDGNNKRTTSNLKCDENHEKYILLPLFALTY